MRTRRERSRTARTPSVPATASWGIADSLELDGGWRSLYVGNKQVVGTDPDHILPGQTLTVTGESGEK